MHLRQAGQGADSSALQARTSQAGLLEETSVCTHAPACTHGDALVAACQPQASRRLPAADKRLQRCILPQPSAVAAATPVATRHERAGEGHPQGADAGAMSAILLQMFSQAGIVSKTCVARSDADKQRSGVLTQARGLCDDNKSVAFGLAAAMLVGFALWRSGLLQDSHGGPPPASRGNQTRRAAPRSSLSNAAGLSAPAVVDSGGASWRHDC